MRARPPLLLPIFRSANQAHILTAAFLGDSAKSLAELSQDLAIPYATVYREVAHLLDAGLLSETRIGNVRLITANRASAFAPPLQQLLEIAFGPVPLLREEFSAVQGVIAVSIFGSWAQRTLGKVGRAPSDVDVLVVGTPKVDEVYDACSRVEKRVGHEVNPIVLSEHEWAQNAPFTDEVRRGGLVDIIGNLSEAGAP